MSYPTVDDVNDAIPIHGVPDRKKVNLVLVDIITSANSEVEQDTAALRTKETGEGDGGRIKANPATDANDCVILGQLPSGDPAMVVSFNQSGEMEATQFQMRHWLGGDLSQSSALKEVILAAMVGDSPNDVMQTYRELSALALAGTVPMRDAFGSMQAKAGNDRDSVATYGQVLDIGLLNSGRAPDSATSDGTRGQWFADDNFLYMCTSTNKWRRVALSAW